jgi:hypothetical protein
MTVRVARRQMRFQFVAAVDDDDDDAKSDAAIA